MLQLAAGIVLYRLRDGEPWLLLMRNAGAKHWSFPKGRREARDRHEVDNARREVEEETGVRDVELDPTFRRVVAYTLPSLDGSPEPVDKRVTYFLGRAPIGEVTLSDEHDDARWVSHDVARRLLTHRSLADVAEAALARIAARSAP